jgi:hypothetical protein
LAPRQRWTEVDAPALTPSSEREEITRRLTDLVDRYRIDVATVAEGRLVGKPEREA